jgi:hypothetical protein
MGTALSFLIAAPPAAKPGAADEICGLAPLDQFERKIRALLSSAIREAGRSV